MHTPFHGNRLSRWLAAVLVVLLSTSAALAQSTANYTFTSSTTGSLVDMSTGTTDALATGTYRDDVASTVQPIGFSFGFMGTLYTQFSVNSNGQLRLGSTVISGTTASPTSGAAILAAFGGDNAIQTTGKVHYKVVTGTNRQLVVEWNSLRIPYSSTVGTGSVVQAILEENTGKVEYRYGAVFNNSTALTRPIFISAGTSAGQIGSVLTFTTTPTYDATGTSATAVALPDNAVVPGLNSTADGSRTTFTFTPLSGTPAAPAVAVTAVGQASLNLVITDNSTNEGYFVVARSTDNTTFTTVGSVLSTTSAATGGTLTFNQTGLTPGTTYYYRVTANNEAGGVSTNATATATTTAAVPICGTKTVGPAATANYPTLTAALAAVTINGLCGPVVFELQADYVSTAETFPLVYNYTGATATNTVTVRPAAGATNLSISSSAAGAVFNIVGGKYLILDGRPGGSGSPVSGAALATDLTIASTSTSGIPLQFTSDAVFNTVQHTQILGVGNNVSSYPNVNFTGTTTTLGNSDNTLQYNTIRDGATTPVTLVYSGSTLNSRNSIIGNNLANFYLAGGSAYGININTAGAGWTISGNSVYQTASRASTAGTLYGINIVGGNGHTVTGNFIGGSAPSAGGSALTVTGTAAAFRFVGIYLSTSGTATSVQGNTIANITWVSSSGASTTYGIVSGIYVSSGDANIGTTTGNVIGTTAGPISVSTTTTGGYSFGISSASTGAVNITGNTISNLSGVGSATVASNVAGILVSAGSTGTISRNKLYTLAAGGASSFSTGIWVLGGTTNTISNNLIGDLQAPASTSLTAVAGLVVAGGTTSNVYYNTISLGATSTGTTFGTSGIYLNSTSATVDLRNNIVVNKSTAVGTGGFTAALRRVSGTAGTVPGNLAATTNNNLYYAGTPSATNVIYVEGTTTATNAQQTLAAYKAFLATREQLSVTEDVPFVSTTGTAATFLHVSTTTATQVEGGATPIASITIDFDGDTRSTTAPDLGADEGTFLSLDLTGPTITYTALPNSNNTTSRTLTVTIADPAGVATGTGAPLLYFRKGTTGAYQSVAATTVSGSTYTFTFTYAALGGVTAGDVIQYYVAAQDALGNVSTSPGGGSGATPPGATAPSAVNSFLITGTLAGTYYVGSSTSPNPARTFPTLTAAINTYNTFNLGGAVTFLLLDATYSANETFPLIVAANADASATNTLTIKPNTSVNSAISGSNATAILALNGADYVTIDGSNGGTLSATDSRSSRNLTITNTNTSATSFVVLGTVPSTTDNATNNTVKNLNVVGSGAAATQVGIAFLSATGGTAGNNNNLIQNNTVQAAQYGIYSFGVSATVKNTGTIISQNDLNATGTAALGRVGIVVGFEDGIQITRNAIDGIAFNGTGDVLGISAGFGLAISTGTFTGSEVTNATITRNNIGAVRQTSTYSAVGIGLASAASGTSVIANNFVSGVSSNGTGGDFGAGIFVGGGTGSTTRIAFNSVNMTGTQTGGSYPSFALAIGGSSPVVDLRNNILANTQSTGANSVALGFAYAGTAGNYAGLTSSNNDFFVGTGSTFAVAQTGSLSPSGVLRATLAALNTETGQDAPATSKNVDPAFASATDLHTNAVALNNAGVPVAGITVDFDGDVRSTTTPDIGADEFTPQTVDVAAAGLVAPATTATCYGTAEAVTVSIRNAGTAALDFSVNPATVTVIVTLPGGTTRNLASTVSTGTLASGASQNVTLTGTLDMSTVGTYSFAITATATGDSNTSNDALTPAPTRTVAAPVAGTLTPAAATLCVSGNATLTLTGAANGSIQYQSSTSATGPFTDIAGATSASYTTAVLTSTTYFRAQVRCNTGVATSNVSSVTVNNPLVATTNTPVTICAGSTATLTATASAGSSVRFFSTATGGTALTTTTAGTYTTPALTANTTYYAEAYVNGSENVGATAYNSTGQTPQTGGALYFTTTGPTTITSVTVYLNAGQAAGTVTIDLRTGSSTTGAVVNNQSTAFNVPAGPTTGVAPYVVPLNYTVPAAGQYTLHLSGATQGGLLRDSGGSNASGYPYTSPSGTVSITAPSVSTYYYYFYNWQIGGECINATRTPIQVNVTPIPATPTVTVNYPTRSTALLTSSAAPTGTTYQWYLGTSAIPGATSQTYTANGTTAPGSYTVRFIATAGGCQSAASTMVAVTGTAQPLAGSSLTLFPNPTTDGKLTLQLSGYTKAVQLTVIDALGRVVLTQRVAAGQPQAQLDLSGAAKGVYQLRATTDGGTDVRRIVHE